MRRNYQFSLLMAGALLGMTACSSSDDPTSDAPVSPNEAVKTSFTLSVGLPQGNTSNAKPQTRVSDNVAQTTGDFRGIDNINLIPFAGEVGSSSTRLGNTNIVLPNTPNNSLTTSQLQKEAGNSRVYNDVEIPVTTDHFLFYGKAVDVSAGQNASTPAEKFQYGTLDNTGLTAGAPSGITFTPSRIYTETTLNNAVATALVTYLNSIVQTSYTTTANPSATSTWADYATAHTTETTSTSLAGLYNRLTSLTSGSSTSIENAVQELYTSLENLNTADLTGDEQALRTAIEDKITSDTYATKPTTGTTLTFAPTLSGFPENLNLPDGAASMTYDAKNHTFAQNTNGRTLSNGVQTPAFNSFAYPISLWYFANTAIRTSDDALSDQYNDKTWSQVLDLYGSNNGSVTPGTRSIALVSPIQYAVGRLSTVVTTDGSTLLDKNGTQITVGATTFPVTGVFIGGQRQVDWQFKPVSPTTATQYTLYDKIDEGTIYATSTNAKANQTLVLESPEGSNDGKVNIVIELKNNSSQQFTGANGVIPVGGKFYLVASLDPTDTHHDNTGVSLNQVFKQDYVTTANLKILRNNDDGHNQGLGAAYNVIPDLRTPVLSIGMSVDLSWQNGLTFDVDM